MNAAQRRKEWRRVKTLRGKPVVVRVVRWHDGHYGPKWMRGTAVWAYGTNRYDVEVKYKNLRGVFYVPSTQVRIAK